MYAFLSTPLARLFLLALQVQSSARFARLTDSAVLDDGRLGLRIILRVAKRVSLEQICARKSFGAGLTHVRLFLCMHTDMSAQVIESRIALGAFPTGIEPVVRLRRAPIRAICVRISGRRFRGRARPLLSGFALASTIHLQALRVRLRSWYAVAPIAR